MSGANPSPVIRIVCRSVARLIQVYALYVVFHGHYSPGGGFQGGALLAAAVILLRMGEGRDGSQSELSSRHALLVGAIGVFIYAAVGIVTLLAGGAFLDYSFFAVPGMEAPDRHYWAILVIEIGVAVAVMSMLVAIFDRLMERDADA